MLEVASEKLTEREWECLKHFRQALSTAILFDGRMRSFDHAR